MSVVSSPFSSSSPSSKSSFGRVVLSCSISSSSSSSFLRSSMILCAVEKNSSKSSSLKGFAGRKGLYAKRALCRWLKDDCAESRGRDLRGESEPRPSTIRCLRIARRSMKVCF